MYANLTLSPNLAVALSVRAARLGYVVRAVPRLVLHVGADAPACVVVHVDTLLVCVSMHKDGLLLTCQVSVVWTRMSSSDHSRGSACGLHVVDA